MLIPIVFVLTSAIHAETLDVESEHISNVLGEVKWDIGGGWTRLVPGEILSDVFYGAGGDYWHVKMGWDWKVDNNERVYLTGRSNLVDHSIVPCPDGGYLHVASGMTTTVNDSAYSFRYDDDFQPLAQSTLAEDYLKVRFNDMALICHENGNFASFIDYDLFGAVIYKLDEDGALLDELRIAELPLPEGGSLLEDPLRGDLALITATSEKTGLLVNWLDWDLNFKTSRRILTVDRTVAQAYWPQAFQIVGGRIILAYIQQPVDAGYVADWGNVWLAVFDHSWNLLENHQITYDPGPGGSMRPGLAIYEDQLLLTYDEIEDFPPGIVQPRLVPITLKLDAFVVPEDTADSVDSAGNEDTEPAGSGAVAAEWKCGCAATSTGKPGAGVWLILGGLLGWRRRR
jgi:MYXO-CTERM domain-containing protein